MEKPQIPSLTLEIRRVAALAAGLCPAAQPFTEQEIQRMMFQRWRLWQRPVQR